MYDLRKYRDNYDKGDLNLYYKLLSPKELFYHKRILDFGCGVGGKCISIIKEQPKVVIGLDLSERNIILASELLNKDNRQHLKFLNRDLLKTRFKDKFNTIISFTVFEHLPKKDIQNILKKFSMILADKGNIAIIYDYYNDRFGSHLSYYIYSPWPQAIFDYSILCSFWDSCFRTDKNQTVNSYFPKKYKMQIGNVSDCYMYLNKLSPKEFENLVYKSGLKIKRRIYYTKSIFLDVFPFLPKKYLLGSVAYLISK